MDYKEKKIIEKIQGIDESELMVEIIIPLLQNLGFFKVDFNHKMAMRHDDLLCWKKNEYDELVLTIVKVKHFELTNISSDSNYLHTNIKQLNNYFEDLIPFQDKSYHYPEKVLLISSYILDTKSLKPSKDKSPHFIDNRITIIDGLKLAQLIIKKRPELLDKFGLEFDIYSKLESSLNNEILLKALGYIETKAIKDIFTDIDFSVGKRTTQLFFSNDFKPREISLELSYAGWTKFKIDCSKIKKVFGLAFLYNTIDEVEDKILPLQASHNKWEEELDILKKNYDKVSKEIKFFSQIQDKIRIDQEDSNNISKISKSKEKFDVLIETILKEAIENIEKHHLMSDENKADFELLIIDIKIKLQNKNIDINRKDLRELYSCILDVLSEKINLKDIELATLKSKEDKHRRKEKKPIYIIRVSGELLVDIIKKNRKWIENKVKQFNSKKPDQDEITYFINKCNKIIDCADILLSNPNILKSIIEGNPKLLRDNFDSARLKLPIDCLFDTKFNFAVLGEAGAGKTTCLQMYTINRQSDSDRLYFYLPLSRVINSWLISSQSKADIGNSQKLIIGITEYLVSNGISTSNEEMQFLLKSRKITLLLDGIDEAIKIAPWLIRGIISLSDIQNENMQIITTSRTSGSYLKDIPFFNLTLLPFTNDQRNSFIKSWFWPEREDIILRINGHLNRSKEISELVKNPLLVTILCVLAENELPLPYTEINLYDERLNLLTGYYDVKKRIDRTITPSNKLLILAQRLAYHLHSNTTREMDMSDLQQISLKLMTKTLSIKNTNIAFMELIDPCNILVPMTDDGKFGFGHLRFQEHLAANAIATDRSIDIAQFLRQNWWRNVLLFFASMIKDLSWIIDELGRKKQITSSSKILLQEMINMRYKFERENLEIMLNQYLLLNNWQDDEF